MSNLVLNKDEFEVLSLLNGKKFNSLSIINGMETINKSNFKKKKITHLKIMDNLYKDGAIWKDKKNKFHLIRELQGAFNIINTPDSTIKIKSSRDKPFSEHYYSKIDNKGVLISVEKDNKFYFISYPINETTLGKWFKEEIIGEFDVDEKYNQNISYEISNDEFILLSQLLSFNSINKKILIEDLFNEETLKIINSKNLIKRKNKIYNKKEKNAVMKNINSLERKGILTLNDNQIKLNPIYSNSFTDNNLKDVIEITEISPFKRGKNLYISNYGFISFEPLITKPLKWNIQILGLKEKTETLLNEWFKFSKVEINEEFKKEFFSQLNRNN